MASALAAEARRRLQRFAACESSLTELYDWLMDHVVATGAERDDEDLRTVLGYTILSLYEYQELVLGREDVRTNVAYLVGSRVAPSAAS